eukprot:TRINITY_DN15815_c0_g1_i1.p1 TRINITY_DN15815_c0_g1~~TRINITY_DN15815_c0_g1_i1.p1  ORF type:complete len:127 (-),score=32.48 TRINITY_DN15815_c0_g1_i1:79-459(-)
MTLKRMRMRCMLTRKTVFTRILSSVELSSLKNYGVKGKTPEVKVKVIIPEEKLAVEDFKSEPDEKSEISAKSEGIEEVATNHNVKEELEVVNTPITSTVSELKSEHDSYKRRGKRPETRNRDKRDC